MVQIAVLVVAILAGLFSRSWQRARLITLIAFIVTTAAQTPMVIANDDIDSPVVYWSIQALTLAVGFAIAWALSARRGRRTRSADLTQRARA